MIEPELTHFVRESLLKGVGRHEIESQLVEGGWAREKAGKALAQFAEIDSAVPVPRPRPYVSAREAFMYLLLFATLYISAFHVGGVLFALIEEAFPDAAVGSDFGIRQSVRWGLASILIAFPVFLLLSRGLRHSLAKDPEKRGSRVRKWLTYLTLFVAASIIIGDLIALVYYFLGGELTTRFLLKVGVVGLVAGCIFGYYLWDLRGEESVAGAKGTDSRPGWLHATFVWVVIVGVALTVVGGIRAIESPGEERMRLLDLKRVDDLQQISSAIDSFWNRSDRLPASLAELRAGRDIWLRSIQDPVTERVYEYRTRGERGYELCAVFEAPSEETRRDSNRESSAFWQHGAGRVCFDAEVN